MRISKSTVIVIAFLLVGLCLSPALADTTTSYTLSVPNLAVTGFTGPYATVDVNLTSSTTASITFTSLINGGYLYLMGDGGSADLNVNGTYLLGAVGTSNSTPGFSTPIFSSNTPGQVDGFGVFNLSLNLFDGFTHSASLITIDLTDTSGTWASAADVLTPNGDGYFAAIHAFACIEPGCSPTSGAAATGFAANGGGTGVSVPEPATLLLLGPGLAGLVGITWRRKRK